MGFNNPGVSWTELERRLSGRFGGAPDAADWEGADGGDSPAWSRHRQAFEAPEIRRPSHVVPYAELHCHSNFSFLDGASHPEELVTEAARLGLEALAITDHDGLPQCDTCGGYGPWAGHPTRGHFPNGQPA